MKRLVSQIMIREVYVVPPEMPLAEVGWFLLQHGISAVPVVEEDGTVRGLVSKTDLLQAGFPGQLGELRISVQPRRFRVRDEDVTLLFGLPNGTRDGPTAADVMMPMTLGVDPRAEWSRAIKLILSRRIHRALVIESGKLVGLVSTIDLLRALDRVVAERESGSE